MEAHEESLLSPALAGLRLASPQVEDAFSTPICSTPVSTPVQHWLLEEGGRPSPRRTHGSNGACTCAICLSPVRRAPLSTRRGISFADGKHSLPRKMPYRTQCCGQLFHRACLAAFKEQADGNTAACPLCRSERNTGLTPLRQPTPHTGFVGASSMRATMRARASAARLAVQRGLSTRAAAEQHLANMTARAEYSSPALSEVDAAFQDALIAGPWIPADGPSRIITSTPLAVPANADIFSPLQVNESTVARRPASAEWRAARYRVPSP